MSEIKQRCPRKKMKMVQITDAFFGVGFQIEQNAKDVRLNGRLAQQTISEYLVQYIGRDSHSDWAHNKLQQQNLQLSSCRQSETEETLEVKK